MQSPRSRRPARILIVDNCQTNRSLLRVALQSQVYQVTEAIGGIQALQLISAEHFDLVILDIVMPDMNGLEVLRRLRHGFTSSQLPIIVVTERHESHEVVEGLALGANDYIAKPIDVPVLLARVRSQLARKQTEEALRAAQEQLEQGVAKRSAELIEINRALEREVAERQQAESVLQDAREYAESIVNTVRDSLVVLDEGLRVVSANKSFYQMFGTSAPRILGQSFFHLGTGQWHIPRLQDQLDAVLANGQSLEAFEVTGEFPVVGVRTMALSARPIYQAPDKPNWILLAIEDVTDRKRAEEALYEAKERALVTLQSIAEGVITTDVAGRIEQMNPVAEGLTGWTLEAAHGRFLGEVLHVVHEQTRRAVREPVQRCLEEGRAVGPENQLVLIHRTGREYSIRQSAAPIRNRRGEILGVVLVFSDLSETRQMAQRMSYQATHDGLTGLVNRREFERRLRRVLAESQSAKTIDGISKTASQHALCYLDLDLFKVINDTCGHIAGDELLRQLSGVLQAQVRKRDTLARLGGDEFGVLMEHCSLEQATRVANTLREAVEDFRFLWEDKSFSIGASIGLVPINETSGSITAVLSAADAACYAAKDSGRNRVHVYHEADSELARRHGEMQWVGKINRALEENRFQLTFHSIVPLDPHEQCGTHYELLLRLREESGRMILPGTFLPAAERYSLAPKLDRWVIRTAFQWLRDHPRHLTHLYLCAINLSGHSLGESEFLAFVTRLFEETEVPPQKICFEVTETAAISNLVAATRFIQALKDIGCRFALDDFGSGVSSFAQLKTLPVDFLKIDGLFVRDIAHDAVDLALVRSINEIGHVMGKKTIAEFVDTEAALARLRQIGVDFAQGYSIGTPQPIEEMH